MTKLVIQKQQKQVQYFTEPLTPDIGLDMILIPGGTFQMGSPNTETDTENGRRDWEGPQHPVTVPTFFMGRYPITQAQWTTVVDWQNKININLQPNPSRFRTSPRHPVERISWHEAQEFCQRLSQRTGRPYRLPTEAEWEYACRGRTTTAFHCGITISPELANYRWEDSYEGGPPQPPKDSLGETTPVDDGATNSFGLSDLHGNVWEWSQDHWHDNFLGAPSDGSAWLDPEDLHKENVRRVIRGGSWFHIPRNCRSASRENYNATGKYHDIGFRVVCQPSLLGSELSVSPRFHR